MTATSPLVRMTSPAPTRLPKSPAITFVVAGRRVADVFDLNALAANDEIDPERLAELKRELRAAKARARYQRDKLDPVKQARRKAYYETHREQLLAWKREYSKTHRAQIQKVQTAWMRRKYREDPSKHLAACRRYDARQRAAKAAREALRVATR